MTKLIIAIIMFVIAGGIVFAYVSPTYTAAMKVKEDAATYQQALEKATEVQNLKRGLLAKLNDFSGANIERLQKLLPEHVDNVRLVLDLDGMAKARGLTLSTVEVHREGASDSDSKKGTVALAGAIAEQQKYQSLTLDFSVMATYEDFLAFLRDLERSLRIVDLVALRVEPTDNGQGQVSVGVPNELSQFANGGAQAPITDPTYRFTISIRTYWLP